MYPCGYWPGCELVCPYVEQRLIHVLLVASQSDLAAQAVAAMVEESLKELLVQIQTPGCAPSPVGAHATEEELFHQKNPMVMFAI